MTQLPQLLIEIRGKDNQKAMADKCGLSRQTISRIESGRAKGRGIRIDTIHKISESYNLSREKYLDLLLAWMRHEMEDDFYNFEIHPLQKNLKDSPSLPLQIQIAAQELKKEEQQAVLLACKNKEVRNALLAMTSFVKKH